MDEISIHIPEELAINQLSEQSFDITAEVAQAPEPFNPIEAASQNLPAVVGIIAVTTVVGLAIRKHIVNSQRSWSEDRNTRRIDPDA